MEIPWRRTAAAATAALLMFLSTGSFAQDLDKQTKALHEIEAAVPIFCTTVPIEGEDHSLRLDGKGDVELSKLLKKLADLNLEGKATYSLDSYKNVLRKDLPKAIQDSNTCRVRVLEMLQKMIPGATSSMNVIGDHNVVSSGQTGGITAGTVIINPAAPEKNWQLQVKQCDSWVQAMNALGPTKLSVGWFISDNDGARIGQILISCFKRTTWNVTGAVLPANPDGVLLGAEKSSEKLDTLQKVLTSFGLRLSPNSDIRPEYGDEIGIIVGSNPVVAVAN